VKLLLVEDDLMLAETVCDGVRQHGWAVDHVNDAGAAKLALVEHSYAAVLLDLGLPGDSGLTVLKWLRERYDSSPVIILTARGQLSDRIRGLDAGADDYVVKPFPFEELLVRIRAVTRRSQGRVVPVMRHGDMVVDPARRLVTRAGERVALRRLMRRVEESGFGCRAGELLSHGLAGLLDEALPGSRRRAPAPAA